MLNRGAHGIGGVVALVLTLAALALSEVAAQELWRGTVTVPANQSWTRTGVILTPGMDVEVSASGAVEATSRTDTRPYYHQVPPEGRRERLAQLPMPMLPGLALLGRIGNGPVFLIGAGARFRVDAGWGTGELLLGINDDVVADNTGAWTAQIVISSATSGTVASAPTAPPPAVATTGTAVTWNTKADHVRGRNGERFAIACPGGGTPQTVWGTDVYTDDSSICTAAVHAGRLTFASGGTVTIEIRPGQSSYVATSRNGVTTSAYGSWHGSYVFVGAAVAGAPPVPSVAPPPRPTTPSVTPGATPVTWATKADHVRGRNGERFVVTCPGGGGAANVWGTDVYTDDSSICTAAVHAGLISFAYGGTVMIEIRPGQASYVASARNGVTTGSYGAWGGSYAFVGAGSAAPPPAAAAGTTPVSWTTKADNLRGRNGERFTFTCPAGGAPATVWGTDVYTDDSSICTAAVHAGLITFAAGGAVTFEIRPGQASYVAMSRHGVATAPYGGWQGSYVFAGAGSAAPTPSTTPAPCPSGIIVFGRCVEVPGRR